MLETGSKLLDVLPTTSFEGGTSGFLDMTSRSDSLFHESNFDIGGHG